MAAVATQYLYQLIIGRRVTNFETALDLTNLAMTSTSITAVSLATASGLAIADIVQAETREHTGGYP